MNLNDYVMTAGYQGLEFQCQYCHDDKYLIFFSRNIILPCVYLPLSTLSNCPVYVYIY